MSTSRRTTRKQARAAVPSVEKALSILEYLGSQKQGFSITELSRIFKIPVSTMNNLLYTLVHCGYLRRDEKGLFRLTMKILGEAAKLIENTELRDVARPALERLTNQTGLDSTLSIRDGTQLVCIDKVEGPSQIRIASSVGKHFHLHSTCTGKAILAHLPEAELDQILTQTGLPAVTPNTITNRKRFQTELSRVRIQRYALDNGENTVGIHGVAAPVFNYEGEVVAALGTGGVDFQLDDRLAAVIGIVKECAQATSEKLGFRESTPATSGSPSLHARQ